MKHDCKLSGQKNVSSSHVNSFQDGWQRMLQFLPDLLPRKHLHSASSSCHHFGRGSFSSVPSLWLRVFQPDIWLLEAALPRFCSEIFTNSCISLLFPVKYRRGVKKEINYLLNISVLYSYIHRPRHVMWLFVVRQVSHKHHIKTMFSWSFCKINVFQITSNTRSCVSENLFFFNRAPKQSLRLLTYVQ